jgi:hypothetical protein
MPIGKFLQIISLDGRKSLVQEPFRNVLFMILRTVQAQVEKLVSILLRGGKRMSSRTLRVVSLINVRIDLMSLRSRITELYQGARVWYCTSPGHSNYHIGPRIRLRVSQPKITLRLRLQDMNLHANRQIKGTDGEMKTEGNKIYSKIWLETWRCCIDLISTVQNPFVSSQFHQLTRCQCYVIAI